VAPRAGLDRRGKFRPPPEFDSRTVQPVASRYTDYATRPTKGKVLDLKRRSNCSNLFVCFGATAPRVP
jgi:hypothetical protein